MVAVRSLDLPFATRLIVFTCKTFHTQPGSVKLSSECLAIYVYCKRCLDETHCFVETIGTDIVGVVFAMGKECYLMYFSEANVTELHKPQPGFVRLWICISQLCS